MSGIDVIIFSICWMALGIIFIFVTDPGSPEAEIWGAVFGPVLLLPILIIMLFERIKRNKNLNDFEGEK